MLLARQGLNCCCRTVQCCACPRHPEVARSAGGLVFHGWCCLSHGWVGILRTFSYLIGHLVTDMGKIILPAVVGLFCSEPHAPNPDMSPIGNAPSVLGLSPGGWPLAAAGRMWSTEASHEARRHLQPLLEPGRWKEMPRCLSTVKQSHRCFPQLC